MRKGGSSAAAGRGGHGRGKPRPPPPQPRSRREPGKQDDGERAATAATSDGEVPGGPYRNYDYETSKPERRIDEVDEAMSAGLGGGCADGRTTPIDNPQHPEKQISVTSNKPGESKPNQSTTNKRKVMRTPLQQTERCEDQRTSFARFYTESLRTINVQLILTS
jgi:hypothetical protein